MYILLTLFILSLLGIVVLIGYQVWCLRTGRVLIGDTNAEVENPLSEENLAGIKNTLSVWFEEISRGVVLIVLRISIRLGYFVKNKLDAIVSTVHRTVAKHERKLKQEEPGETFLSKISDYKDKIKTFRKK